MTHPYVLFEIANTHGGNIDHLNRLVDAFADFAWPRKGLKFQVFQADTLALSDFSWYETYQQLTQAPETWGRLIEKTYEHGDVWIDIFDVYGTDILRRYLKKISGIKLQSSILDNVEVIAKLGNIDLTRCDLIINIAGHSLSQIHKYVSKFRQFKPANLILQAGFQDYPTAVSDTGLQKVSALRAAFPELPVCFADHARGTSTAARSIPALAVTAGCSIIEKHFCISREEAVYDSHSALEPDEVRKMLDQIHTAAAASSGPFISASEAEYLKQTYQVPIAQQKLPAGSLVGKDDLLFRRTDQEGMTWPTIKKAQKRFHVLEKDIEQGSAVRHDSFRNARIGVIVACRMKSSRLKKKATRPLHGVPSVERCLENCLMIEEADTVVLATSDLNEDAILADYTLGGRAKFVQGDPEDVISRYIKACDRFGIDTVVRVTADCPVISPEITSMLLDHHFKNGADYTTANDHAVGSVGEIYNTEALRRVIELKSEAKHSEYMTWYLVNNPHIFKIERVDLPTELVRDYRLTLDYPEDEKMFNQLFKELDQEGIEPRLRNVFKIMDENPSIPALNDSMTLKYKEDKELIKKLNQETKINA